MSAISTHVLDIAAGRPAAGLRVRLEHVTPAETAEIARATTDSGGRVTRLGPDVIEPGTYRLVFETGGYHGQHVGTSTDAGAFFPEVAVTFAIADGGEHYHVPLLLSPFGYSTYRGS
jgi:5-hydroxyisourate hydrolase